MKIVHLAFSDAMAVISLDKLAFKNYDIPPITEKQIHSILNSGFILGIRDDLNLVSNIQVMKEDRDFIIHGIATVPEKQEFGFADKLLKEVIRIAKSEKCMKISATVKPGNIRSFNLFRKNGFKKIKLLKDYYGKGKDRILMELPIII